MATSGHEPGQTPHSSAFGKSRSRQIAKLITGLTALIVAVTGLIAAVIPIFPPLKVAIKEYYCDLFGCRDLTIGSAAQSASIPQECTTGKPPSDAIAGDNVFLDNTKGGNSNKGKSCITLKPGQNIKNIWCHITNDHPPNDNYWCAFPGGNGRPAEERCGLWGDTRAWPENIHPINTKQNGVTELCVSAVNWSNWANRHFQIYVK